MRLLGAQHTRIYDTYTRVGVGVQEENPRPKARIYLCVCALADKRTGRRHHTRTHSYFIAHIGQTAGDEMCCDALLHVPNLVMNRVPPTPHTAFLPYGGRLPPCTTHSDTRTSLKYHHIRILYVRTNWCHYTVPGRDQNYAAIRVRRGQFRTELAHTSTNTR